jgi:hypothetical protein
MHNLLANYNNALHVSTLLCHPQGPRSQYLAKLHKYVSVVVGGTIYNFSMLFVTESHCLKLV